MPSSVPQFGAVLAEMLSDFEAQEHASPPNDVVEYLSLAALHSLSGQGAQLPRPGGHAYLERESDAQRPVAATLNVLY